MAESIKPPHNSRWRTRLHEIIFEADTASGKAFNIILLVSIICSVVTVILDSVKEIHIHYGEVLSLIEWSVTILFTIEYVLRLLCVKKPLRYVISFYGIVDLLTIIPTWMSFFFGGFNSLLIIRAFRLLRIFRIFKLAEYLYEVAVLQQALIASMRKIAVFLLAVMIVVVVIGSFMYAIEGSDHGFTDIPTSMYWTIVTITTVGYGDIAPQTGAGKLLASLAMLLGYGIIAVPTGIVTVELANLSRKSSVSTQACPVCGKDGHAPDARYCRFCGSEL